MIQDPTQQAIERAAASHADDQPADNTAAVATLAAVTGERHVITQIAWSYDDAPTGGNLVVTDGGTTIFSVDITAGGADVIHFPNGLIGSLSSAVVVTLAAGGAGIAGKLNVSYV